MKWNIYYFKYLLQLKHDIVKTNTSIHKTGYFSINKKYKQSNIYV